MLRFFSRRRIIAALGIAVLVIVAAIAGAIAYVNSTAFEARARRSIIDEIQRRTGATVTLRDFYWSFWERRFRLEDLVLHGLEGPDHAPLAHFTRIDVGLNFRTLLQHQIDLFELTITQPEFHVIVTPDGKTNFPTPETQTLTKPADFEISIENFNVVNGSAILNERRIDLDLSLTNLTALLNYDGRREVLNAHLHYDGVVDRSPGVRLAIPYTLSADLDYTRATVLAHRVIVTSAQNELKLQGKINQVLSTDISGKLEYTGAMQVPFLNYFFIPEKFSGKATAQGFLEFSTKEFFTQGVATSEAIDFEGWHATKLSGEYTYRYPDRRLTLRNFKNEFVGGSVVGDAEVQNLPGPSRVHLNLHYANLDAESLKRAFPWDPRYRIYSTASGTLNGWFEGKLRIFNFSGHIDLKSYQPSAAADIVALPVDGSTDFGLTPEETRVANADMRLHSTALKAEGLIHSIRSDLKVNVNSPDTKDIAFLYPDANGSATFVGTVSGPIGKPVLNGEFTLDNHVYRQWTIQHALGGIRLDLTAESAILKNVRVRQGDSEIVINGSAALSGSPIDVRLESNRVTAQDIRPFVNREIGGVFAGDVRITSISPNIKLEGDLRADNLSLDNRLLGNARGHVRFVDPLVEISQLSVRQAGSTLTGNVSFDRVSQSVEFTARVNSVNLQMFYPFGLPDAIQGVIQQADLQGHGTIQQPNVRGTATLQNISIDGETFPQVRVALASMGTKLDAEFDAGRNLNLKAQIDTAAPGYPFTARASFIQYHLEHVAKLSEGSSIIATGNANVSGVLSDSSRLRGEGRIETADIRVRDTTLHPTQPFTFSFDPNELTITSITITGQSTEVNLAGTIGLREPAPLNVRVTGAVDLKLIEARVPNLLSTGVINLEIDVRGTTQAPDLRGSAVLRNASLRRTEFFTGLTNLNGTLSFNQNQIRIDKIEGTAGGGTVTVEGTALLQGGTVQGMNVQIDGKNVRLRGYPEGMRTVVNAGLRLRGSLESPLLEGNVQIESLALRSNFEDFLALMSDEKLHTPSSSPIGGLRLSVHIEGGKNITIQNQLADVEARVDLDWKGTVDEPSITGHIEASGGTLSFQGNKYTVTRGNIDFVDPLRVQPVLDIEAESQVRDYRVILSITGRGDNPKLSIRSDPPLPELEIVSLIAGGRTREELAAQRNPASSVPSSERLFQSGATSILFDLLRQRVGNRLGLLGTGRVRIDPFLVGTEATPGTRITLSEQVTKDLTVTYSQDLSSNRQQVILIEYFVSRNSSILASRDELGNFGLDLRHRTRIK
jgi:translocation and assembly module TamB